MKNKIQLILLIVVLAANLAFLPGPTPSGQLPENAPDAAATTIFLPLAVSSAPVQAFFGVELITIDPSGGLSKMVQAGAGWVRRNGLLWAQVEPTKGSRNWDTALETELVNAAKNGLKTILVVRQSPSWAQKYSNTPCGPVAESALGAFAQFMRDAVARYSKPPYNVKYWEIWNEPDIKVNTDNQAFGCWGETNSPYYGGEYYGEMLKAVYPAIKAADPNSQVLVGGLLLDCDPNVPAACTDTRPPRFLMGILRVGGGDYFDGVSFHAYDYYQNALGRYGNEGWRTDSTKTGPVVIAKAKYLRETLDSYGLTEKYLVNTESALLAYGSCNSTCEQTKAYYVAQVYTAALAANLRANIWFSATGDWLNSGLLGAALSPLPAYDAYSFARTKLMAARVERIITSYSGVKIYELKAGARTIWVAWSMDGASHTIALPSTPNAIFNVFGVEQTVSGTNVTITLEPFYIQW